MLLVFFGNKLRLSDQVKSFLVFFYPLLSCFFSRFIGLYHSGCFRYFAFVRSHYHKIHWFFYFKCEIFHSLSNFFKFNYFSWYYSKTYLCLLGLSEICHIFNIKKFGCFKHLISACLHGSSTKICNHSHIPHFVNDFNSFLIFQKKSLLILKM